VHNVNPFCWVRKLQGEIVDRHSCIYVFMQDYRELLPRLSCIEPMHILFIYRPVTFYKYSGKNILLHITINFNSK
jgi:hypothetical protein